jgi:hypothetical protein
MMTSSPIVSCARTIFVDVKVLRIVNISIRPCLNTIYNARFKIEENSARNVASIVGLIEKDVFAITTFCREIFEITLLTDTVLLT